MIEKLRPHIGHKIVCVAYGDIDNPSDICIECEDCCEVLISSETFNVSEGEWIPYEVESYGQDFSETTWYKCSLCGGDAHGRNGGDEWYSSPIRSKCCPHCGAKMREVKS